jgi:L-lactate dehydrogenase complex protein LldG
MSRDKILSAVLQNQPGRSELPLDLNFELPGKDVLREQFIRMMIFIGGQVVHIQHLQDIDQYVAEHFKPTDRVISPIPELLHFTHFTGDESPHQFEDIELAILKPHFAVAENGSVWITEDLMGNRVIPFICQNLAVVVYAQHILATMHEAYKHLQSQEYGFGAFIAGPSKTADIEQSLVLGAHGPRSLVVFLI